MLVNQKLILPLQTALELEVRVAVSYHSAMLLLDIDCRGLHVKIF